MGLQGASEISQKKESWKTVLTLAYQSLGVVYGDLSLSPLYVYKSTFAEDIHHSENNEEIYGVLSFVFWTLTLLPLFKYVFIVLRADDNGEGGTFALYSLLCRHAKVGPLPNHHIDDEEISTYKMDLLPVTKYGSRIKTMLEKQNLQTALLIVALLGTCMTIGDGMFTPAISVFSAVSGLEYFIPKECHGYVVVPIACFILACLFALQHYGTHRLGFMFAPIIMTWLLCISALGLYNIIFWNPQVYYAISPSYMYKFLSKTRQAGWKSLGGILLCITGSEAMFADLGHFSQLSIQIAFTSMVYPALILAYMGQAAYISQHHEIDDYRQIDFYLHVPEYAKWPVMAIAILASVVGSQAVITGTFSIINQSLALGCFPKVKVVHTSDTIHGQVYIPEANWILMILCLAITVGFRDVRFLGNASGLAVITVMLVTTFLMSLIIILCWHKSILVAVCFLIFFGSIEGIYFSTSLVKFKDGAWVPLMLSFIFMTIMYVWNYVKVKKYEFDLKSKVSLDWLINLGPSLGIARVPGIGLIYTELVTGIPAFFSHLVTNLPAFHQVLIFVCIKTLPVPYVPPEERYLMGRMGPKEYRVYRCIIRYGYRDTHKDHDDFESQLIFNIGEFILSKKTLSCSSRTSSIEGNATVNGSPVNSGDTISKISSYKVEVGLQSTAVSNYRSSIAQRGRDYSPSPPQRKGKNAVTGTEVQSVYATVLPGKEAEGHLQSNTLSYSTSPIIQGMHESESPSKKVRFLLPTRSPEMDPAAREELQELLEAKESGTAFILGHTYVKARGGSIFLKKFVIEVVYDFLKRNCRGAAVALQVPHAVLLEVAMVYSI